MAALIDSFASKKPEALLCASDDIALDAIEALKAGGCSRTAAAISSP